MIVKSIESLKFDLSGISTLILTHRHIDHIGGAPRFREAFGSKIMIHRLDAPAVEERDLTKPRYSATA